MQVYICGIDGYIGWALKHYLEAKGHTVRGCDNLSRRRNVAEVGSQSAIPILDPEARGITELDLADGHTQLREEFRTFKPDAIVHLAQMPSAPYSMKDYDHARWTHRNNIEGNLSLLYAMRLECSDAHLIKLGTMGASTARPTARSQKGISQ